MAVHRVVLNHAAHHLCYGKSQPQTHWPSLCSWQVCLSNSSFWTFSSIFQSIYLYFFKHRLTLSISLLATLLSWLFVHETQKRGMILNITHFINRICSVNFKWVKHFKCNKKSLMYLFMYLFIHELFFQYFKAN